MGDTRDFAASWMVTDAELDSARFPELLIAEALTRLRAMFHPIQEFQTKVQRDDRIGGIRITVSPDIEREACQTS